VEAKNDLMVAHIEEFLPGASGAWKSWPPPWPRRRGPSTAPTLCDRLGEVGEMKIRRVICEALANSCMNDVDVLIHRPSDKRWLLVRNILYVLGRIAHQGVERALGDALYHSDPRVR
jgi:hypothetical protein